MMMHLFSELNARSARFARSVLDGLSESRLFITLVALTLIMQVAIVQFGGEFFKTVPISLTLWMWSLGLGASVLLVGFALRKLGAGWLGHWDTDGGALASAGAEQAA